MSDQAGFALNQQILNPQRPGLRVCGTPWHTPTTYLCVNAIFSGVKSSPKPHIIASIIYCIIELSMALPGLNFEA